MRLMTGTLHQQLQIVTLHCALLGAFAKLRKVAISVVMSLSPSVSLSVRME